jgi:hypothetical protein
MLNALPYFTVQNTSTEQFIYFSISIQQQLRQPAVIFFRIVVLFWSILTLQCWLAV